MMIHTARAFLQPVKNMNRRLSIGGTALSLIVVGGYAMTLFRPLV